MKRIIPGTLKLRIIFVLILLELFSISFSKAATRYSVATGNWNNTSTWSNSSGGTAGYSAPVAGDVVYIERGYTVTVTANAACTSITFRNTNDGNSTLTFSGAYTLTVSGAISMNRPGTAYDYNLNVNTGSVSCATLTMSASTGGRQNNINISTGSFTVTGTTTTAGTDCQFIFTNTGSLTFGGTTTWTGAPTLTTYTGSTVTYSRSGIQTVIGANYLGNLVLSGTDAKTLQTGTTSIGGNLTFSGTASAAAVTGLMVSGDVILGSGTTFNASTYTHSVAGNWTNNGGTFTYGTSTVNFTGNSSAINGNATSQTFYNLIVNKTSGQTLSVSGSTTTLNVNNAFTETAGNFTAPATMTVSGAVTLTSGTFTAGTTIDAAGNWTNNGGTFDPGTGTINFTGNSSAINGTATSQTFYNLTVNKTSGQTLSVGGSTTTLNVNNTVTLTLGTFAAPATINVAGDWTNNGGTFTYGTSTVTMTGSGKTIGGSSASTFYKLTLSGTASVSTGAAVTVSNNLVIGNGTTFYAAANSALTVNGTTTIGGGASGTFTISAYNSSPVLKGLVTVNSGAIWNNSANSPVNFQGGLTNSGTFTPGTGTQTFNTNAQSLTGTIDFSAAPIVITGINLTNNSTLTSSGTISGTGALINSSGYTATLSGAVSVTTLTNTGAMTLNGANTSTTLTNQGTMAISGPYQNPTSLINQGTLTITSTGGFGTVAANFTNTGTIDLNGGGYITGITNNAGGTVNYINASQTIGAFNNATATSTLNISALSYTINTLTATATGNTVNYSGSGDQTVKNVTYSNLTLSGSGTKTFAGATTVTGNLVMSGSATATPTTTLAVSGTTTLSGTSVLTLGAANILSSTPIVLAGGTFRSGATTGYGETVGTLGLTSNSTIALGTGSHTLTFANSSGETWTGTTLTITGWTGTAGSSGTAGKIFVGNDNTGLTASQLAKINFSGYQSGASILSTGEIVPQVPLLSVSPTSINFGYVASGGTSSNQTYTLSGTNLTGYPGNVTVTAPANFQVSLSSGSGFGSSVSVPYTTATLAGTTIYVRFQPTSTNTNYSGNVTNAGGGATTQNVAVSGTSIYSCTASGTILMERWDGIGTGTAVTDLTGNANYPETPSSTSQLTSFEIPTDNADSYGVRIRGYICTPETGNYTFWIASDDNSELWLSTDATPGNRVNIATVTNWTNSQEWDKYSTQKSTSVSLAYGQQYYIEALMKEGTGGDNLAVGWAKPGEGTTTPSEVIPGSVLSPYIEAVTGVVVTPASASVAVSYTTALTATVSPNNAANKNVTWSSSNNSIATVNASGVVTGVAVGSVTITATTVDGGFSSNSTVTVTVGCISSQPSNSRVCPGDNTSFSITTTGTTLGWWRSTNGGTTWTQITAAGTNPTYGGYNSATLTLTNVPASADNYLYQCRVSVGCPATSNNAQLNVGGIINTYSFTSSPDLIDPGESSTLTLSGSQVGVMYQLQTGGDPETPAGTAIGSPVAGTGSALSFTVTPSLSTTYTVMESGCMVNWYTTSVIVNSDDLIIDLHPCAGQPGANFFTNSEFGTTTSNYGSTQPSQTTNPGVVFGNPLGAAYTNYTFGFDSGDEVNDGYYVIANSTNGMYNSPDANDTWLDIYDNTQKDGTGHMYIVNASYTAGEFYTETLTGLCDSTKYEFSADIINLYSPDIVPYGTSYDDSYFPTDNQDDYYSILPNIDFLINGKVALNTGNMINDGTWHTFGFTFRTGGLSSLTLTMRNNSTGGIGNDIAIDNIVMRACGPEIELDILTSMPVCPGVPVTMTAQIVASDYHSPVFQWQRSTDGGSNWTNISGANDTTYTENNPVNGDKYRFITGETIPSLTNSNCYVASNPVTIETTADILTTTPATRCTVGTLTLGATANSGSTINWYDALTGGNLVGSGASFTTPSLSTTTTYYVDATQNGCTSSPRVAVVATVYASAVTASVSISADPGTNLCSGNNVTFTATPTNGGTAPLYQWKKNGTSISGATNSTYTTNTLVNNDVITCVMTENPDNTCITGSPATPTSNSLTMTVASMAASVSIAASPTSTVCSGSSVTFTATPTNGGAIPTYQWKLNGSNVGANSPTYTSSTLANSDQVTCVMTSSFICATNNPATSNIVTMTVNPIPAMTSASSKSICSGSTVSLALTSNVASSYTWIATDNANVTGESASTQSTGTISDNLVNTTATAQNVVYTVTPTSTTGSCVGTAQTVTITVNPTPTVSSAATGTICSGVAQNYDITSAVAGTTYTWGRAAVTGISNAAASGQTSDPITETLTNTTSSAVNVVYLITPSANGCSGTQFTYTVTVNPKATVSSSATGTICSGVAQNYDITSAVAGTTYSWSRAAVTGISNAAVSAQTSDPITETLTNTTSSAVNVVYLITPSANGCSGTQFTYTVTVNPKATVSSSATGTICSGVAQNYDITSAVAGTTYSWSRAAVTGISNTAVSAQTSDPITETLTNTTSSAVNVVYLITPSANGCSGTQFTYTVTVNPKATVSSSATGTICSGVAQNYDITSAVAGTTYSWSRAAVTGISNTAVSAQTSDPITETLTNTTSSAVNVVYLITPSANGCSGTQFTYTVTVNPKATVSSSATGTICSGVAQNYDITSAVAGTTYSWSRAAVTGISNTAVSAQTSDPITETLTNTTSSAVNVVYLITPTANGCSGTQFTYTVTVNPKATVSSSATGTICSGVAQNYDITSAVAGTTYSWSRAAVTGISNTAVSAQTSDPITETLTNTTSSAVNVIYLITPSANGCSGTQFTYTVTVNPKATVSSAATGTICSGVAQNYDITSAVTGTTYTWGRAAVTGISNTAVSAQTSDPITETLTNTTSAAVNVVYLITPSANSCTGTQFTYTATVNPKASVTAMTATVCSGTAFTATPVNGTNGVVPAGTTYSWSAPTGTGFTGGAASSGTPTSIGGALTNTTSAAVTAVYTVTPTSGTCPGTSFTLTVTVNPLPTSVISGTETICNGSSTNLSVALTGAQPWSITYTDGTTPVTITGITTSPRVISVSPTSTKTYTVTAVTDANCSGTSMTGSAVITVVPQPTAPTLLAKTPNQAIFCPGAGVSATFNAGSGGTGCTDDYIVIIDGGASTAYTPGTTVGTTATASIDIQGRRANCTGTSGCSGTSYVSLASWVVDNVAPTIVCPANVTQNVDAGLCTALVTLPAPTTLTDDCGGTPTLTWTGSSGVTVTDATHATVAVGTSTITYTATDASGNTSECSFDITVTDNIPPSISCPPGQTVFCIGNAPIYSTLAEFTTAGGLASDICSLNSGSLTHSDAYSAPTLTRTYQIADAAGNISTCDQVFTIVSPPTVTIGSLGLDNTCAGGTLTITSSLGSYSGTVHYQWQVSTNDGASWSDIGTDNASLINTTLTNLGDQYQLLVSETTDFGQSACNSISNVLTFVDVTDPVFTGFAPANQTVCTVGGAGSVQVYGNNLDNSKVTDNCTSFGNLTIQYSISGATTVSLTTGNLPDPTNFNVGVSTVQYTVTDESGNSQTHSFNVTVNQSPAAITISDAVVSGSGSGTSPYQCGDYLYYVTADASVPEAGYTYTWKVYAGAGTGGTLLTPGTDYQIDNSTSPYHAASVKITWPGSLTPGTYTIEAIKANANCDSRATQQITLNNSFNLTVNDPGHDCKGESLGSKIIDWQVSRTCGTNSYSFSYVIAEGEYSTLVDAQAHAISGMPISVSGTTDNPYIIYQTVDYGTGGDFYTNQVFTIFIYNQLDGNGQSDTNAANDYNHFYLNGIPNTSNISTD